MRNYKAEAVLCCGSMGRAREERSGVRCTMISLSLLSFSFLKYFFPSTLLSSLQSYSCFLCAFSFPQAFFFLCRELWPTELYPWHPCSLLRGSASVPVSLNRREQRSREIQSMVKARKSAVRYGGEGRVRGEGRREGKICLARR